MKKAVFFLLLCVFLRCSMPVRAQSGMAQAIAASFPPTKATADRTDIVTAGAVMTLKKDGVLMFATTAPVKAMLNCKDGKISPSFQTKVAAYSGLGHTSSVVQRTYVAGEKLWLIDIQPVSDGVNLVFLSDAVGDNRYLTSIKFAYGKGGPNNPEPMKAQIAEVISPDSAGQPSEPAKPSEPTPPAEAPIVPPPPPPPPPDATPAPAAASGGWRVDDLKNGSEAKILGTESSGGHSSDAVLGIACSVTPGQKFNRSGTVPSPLSLDLRVRSNQTVLSNPLYCDPGLNDGGTVTVAGKHAVTAHVCNTSANPQGNIWTFQIFIPPATLREIASSPGKPLSVKMGTDKPDEVTATFQLPADGSQLASLVDTCLQSMPASPVSHTSRK